MSKATLPTQIDLTLLKRLVAELDQAVQKAESQKTAATDKNDVIVAFSFAAGLTTSIVSEAALLMQDLQHFTVNTGAGKGESVADIFKSLAGGLKGSGSTN